MLKKDPVLRLSLEDVFFETIQYCKTIELEIFKSHSQVWKIHELNSQDRPDELESNNKQMNVPKDYDVGTPK